MARMSLAEKVLSEEFRNELDRILDEKGRRTKKDGRVASVLTRQDRRDSLRRIFATLVQMGYKLRSPYNLREKHVQVFVWRLIDEGKSGASIQGDLSTLRQFVGWIGKSGMIGETSAYARNDEDRARLSRQYVATVSKAWDSNGVDTDSVIAEAKDRSERAALYITLMRDFGLRLREAVCLKPIRDIQMDNQFLSVRDGTKGGRPRMIPITNEAQRRALEWAVRVANKKSGRITPPGQTLEQAYNFARNRMRGLGLTRNGLGVTPHGLRHQYAQKTYEEIARRPSPIRGGDPTQIDIHMHHSVCYQVMERLGHGRIDVGGTYYGSYGNKLRRKPRQTWSPFVQAVEPAEAPAAKPAEPVSLAKTVPSATVVPNYGALNVIPITRMVIRLVTAVEGSEDANLPV